MVTPHQSGIPPTSPLPSPSLPSSLSHGYSAAAKHMACYHAQILIAPPAVVHACSMMHTQPLNNPELRVHMAVLSSVITHGHAQSTTNDFEFEWGVHNCRLGTYICGKMPYLLCTCIIIFVVVCLYHIGLLC